MSHALLCNNKKMSNVNGNTERVTRHGLVRNLQTAHRNKCTRDTLTRVCDAHECQPPSSSNIHDDFGH